MLSYSVLLSCTVKEDTVVQGRNSAPRVLRVNSQAYFINRLHRTLCAAASAAAAVADDVAAVADDDATAVGY